MILDHFVCFVNNVPHLSPISIDRGIIGCPLLPPLYGCPLMIQKFRERTMPRNQMHRSVNLRLLCEIYVSIKPVIIVDKKKVERFIIIKFTLSCMNGKNCFVITIRRKKLPKNNKKPNNLLFEGVFDVIVISRLSRLIFSSFYQHTI